jgi:glycosyltransferase involved in cell wall biosynthesis
MFTEYARKEVLQALRPQDVPPIEVIPLGVDTQVFFPFPGVDGGRRSEGVWDTRPAKQALKLFADEAIDDSFLVLNAHRNQPRKRIDITIKAFAAFAGNKPPNVQLYLHMGIEDMGWHVLKLARRYGVFDRLIVTQNRNAIPGIASEHLNMLYNACDVGLNTSSGEGWGLPNFEHAAAGKAQVVPRFGALREIWGECAELVEPAMGVVYEFVLSEGNLVSVEGVAAALEAQYSDPGRRRRVAEACYRRATRPEHRWEDIGGRWHRLFQEVLEG